MFLHVSGLSRGQSCLSRGQPARSCARARASRPFSGRSRPSSSKAARTDTDLGVSRNRGPFCSCVPLKPQEGSQHCENLHIPGPSKGNMFLLITFFWLILPIERNFLSPKSTRANFMFRTHFVAKSCKFGHQKCAEIGGKCAEIGGNCAEIGGKPKTHFF